MTTRTQLRRPHRSRPATLLVSFGAALVASLVAGQTSDAPRAVPIGQTQDPAREAAQRRQAQLATLDQFQVFHEFTLRDRQPESGITFQHQITADSAKEYKPNHYDHGNGLAVADVDGDDRLDLYFVSQTGSNGLWRNLGNGRFEDITQTAGVGLSDRIGASASFADYDNDGDADLFVTTVKFGNVLFQNDGSGTFIDVTKSAGLHHVGHSSGAVFFDYDRDGHLDLFVTNVGVYTTDALGPGGYYIGFGFLEGGQSDAFGGHLSPDRTERSLLYRNLGDGRFEDVTTSSGLVDTGWSGDASPTDLNGDGYPDLYVLSMQGDDRYWENVEGKRFVEKTKEYFSQTPWGSMGVKFFDQNNDGRQDLILTDMHSDMSIEVGIPEEKRKSDMQWPDEFLQGGADNIFGNAFYRRQADGSFAEISDPIGAENYWPWGLSTGDLNADGWEDVFIASSMNFPWRYGINTVLLNNRGDKLLDSEYILGVEPRRGGAAMKPWVEMDCDGADANRDQCNGRSGRFQLLGTLGSRSSAIFDADGDGDLDIITNEFNSEPLVLVSDLSARKPIRYLQVALVGSRSNRDGLGAEITVSAGGKRYTRVLDGVSGYLSHSRMPLYFGLGDAATIESVEVKWPSGMTQTLTEGIQINSTLKITEEAEARASE